MRPFMYVEPRSREVGSRGTTPYFFYSFHLQFSPCNDIGSKMCVCSVTKFQVIIKCGTHTRLFETNRFRIVSDLWNDRGLKPILGTQNRRMTPSVPHRLSESRFPEKGQVEERTIFFSILPRLPAKLNVAKKSIFSKNSSRASVPEHAATRG